MEFHISNEKLGNITQKAILPKLFNMVERCIQNARGTFPLFRFAGDMLAISQIYPQNSGLEKLRDTAKSIKEIKILAMKPRHVKEYLIQLAGFILEGFIDPEKFANPPLGTNGGKLHQLWAKKDLKGLRAFLVEQGFSPETPFRETDYVREIYPYMPFQLPDAFKAVVNDAIIPMLYALVKDFAANPKDGRIKQRIHKFSGEMLSVWKRFVDDLVGNPILNIHFTYLGLVALNITDKKSKKIEKEDFISLVIDILAAFVDPAKYGYPPLGREGGKLSVLIDKKDVKGLLAFCNEQGFERKTLITEEQYSQAIQPYLRQVAKDDYKLLFKAIGV